MSPREPSLLRITRVERRIQIGVLVIIGAVLAGLAAWLISLQPPLRQTVKPSAQATGSLFTDLFSVAFRPDQGTGNVAIGAVYYFPALQKALANFSQKSQHQHEVWQALVDQKANTETLAFYLLVDSVVVQDGIDLSQATLTDGLGQHYPLRTWQKLLTSLPQESGQVRRAALLFFDATSDAGKLFSGDAAETLTLSLPNIDGVAARDFSWQLRVLPL